MQCSNHFYFANLGQYLCNMKKAYIQLHIAIFLAGFTAVLGKLILLNEAWLVWYRILLTVAGFFLILKAEKSLVKLPLKELLKIAGVGAIIAVHWLTFYGSVKYGNISIALVCLSAMAFFTAFIEPLVFKRKIDWLEVLLGLMAIAGIYIIFDFHPQYKLGIIFGIIAALGSSIFPVFNKQFLMKGYTPKVLTFYELSGGLIFLTLALPFYLYQFPAAYWWPTATDWLWMLVLVMACTIIAFILQLNALKRVSPFTSTLSYNLEPLYGIIMGFVFFNEGKSFGKGFYIGVTMIMLTIVFHTIHVYYKIKKAKSGKGAINKQS